MSNKAAAVEELDIELKCPDNTALDVAGNANRCELACKFCCMDRCSELMQVYEVQPFLVCSVAS